ncbi:ATP-grasp domain-containing protein [Haloferula sp. BvORR071]|uniref:ATP-grasp domain-containing protein n=1 Tax=Haloferula sp. BvORR071 TaxID=1396141 RepID=UPI00069867ED|nr:ATP-grasp domain-containing protein [Haloferula sp. BvORR071]
MEAYILDAEQVQENAINYHAASLGFYRLGYYVEKFQLPQLPELKVTEETPVFGGTSCIKHFFPDYVSIPHYPDSLQAFLHREIEVRAAKDIRDGEFFKPLEPDHKLFTPKIKDGSLSSDLALQAVPPDRPVYVTRPLKILAEYRCYVLHREVLAVNFYKGDWAVFPDPAVINSMVEKFEDAPVAYGLDVGVLDDGKNVLIEVNDFCCLGNYGIRPTPYAAAIAARWEQLWKTYRA